MRELEQLIGMPLEQALALFPEGAAEVVDFSRPDKFHVDIPAGKRVVKVAKQNGKTILFAAGFADRLQEKE